MQVSGSPAQLRHCRQLFPLKHGNGGEGLLPFPGASMRKTVGQSLHICAVIVVTSKRACAPTRAADCAPAQAENTIHKSGGSCGQANRELMRGCPVERILSWRERRNHSRRAEI